MVSAEYSREHSQRLLAPSGITRNPTVDLRAVDLSVVTQPGGNIRVREIRSPYSMRLARGAVERIGSTAAVPRRFGDFRSAAAIRADVTPFWL